MKSKILLLLITLIFSLNSRAQEFTEIYIAGEAVPAGWDASNPEVMTSVEGQEGVFVWTGKLIPGDFKFLLTIDWWHNCLNAKTENESVIVGQPHELVYVPNYFEEGDDHKFIFNETGFYTITVDTKQMIMTIEGEAIKTPDTWITGSAIPGGIARLEEDPAGVAGRLRYYGKLLQGEFKIVTTETIDETTEYYVPVMEDVDAYSEGMIQKTSDETLAGWNVMAEDDEYKIKIDVFDLSYQGRIYRAPIVVYIIGGATEAGWDAGAAIPLVRNPLDEHEFTFVGILKNRHEGEDPNHFKFILQKDWRPYSFHPQTLDEDILTSSYMTDNIVQDYKWAVNEEKQGYYSIKLHTFNETIEAEFFGDNPPTSLNEVVTFDQRFNVYQQERAIKVEILGEEENVTAFLSDLSGNIIATVSGKQTDFLIGENLQKGMYILNAVSRDTNYSSKIIIK